MNLPESCLDKVFRAYQRKEALRHVFIVTVKLLKKNRKIVGIGVLMPDSVVGSVDENNTKTQSRNRKAPAFRCEDRVNEQQNKVPEFTNLIDMIMMLSCNLKHAIMSTMITLNLPTHSDGACFLYNFTSYVII